jgi:two-component SAPR family response regulator
LRIANQTETHGTARKSAPDLAKGRELHTITAARYNAAAVTRMSALRGRRILVVEDEALIALDLHRLLDQTGATVIGPAVSVSQALEAINENHIDFALLDIKLGDETVDPVAEVLAKRAIPTIFVTAYGEDKLPPGFETHPLIEKPYAEDQLLTLIGSIFSQTGSPTDAV